MYIVNHFLDLSIGSVLIPDDPADSTTNSAASIEAQVNLCSSMYGHMPTGVLVDYFNVGKYILRFDIERFPEEQRRLISFKGMSLTRRTI
jgi:hypothetical protein